MIKDVMFYWVILLLGIIEAYAVRELVRLYRVYFPHRETEAEKWRRYMRITKIK